MNEEIKVPADILMRILAYVRKSIKQDGGDLKYSFEKLELEAAHQKARWELCKKQLPARDLKGTFLENNKVKILKYKGVHSSSLSIEDFKREYVCYEWQDKKHEMRYFVSFGHYTKDRKPVATVQSYHLGRTFHENEATKWVYYEEVPNISLINSNIALEYLHRYLTERDLLE